MALAACQNRQSGNEARIISAFTGPCTGKYINLEKALGDSFIISTATGPQAFKLKYLSKSENNLITGPDGQVLYRGPVVRSKGRYYMAMTNPDSSYWIAALELKKNLIKGFIQFETQMRLIDDTMKFWIRSEVNRPGYVIAAGKNKISLDPNEKVLHVLYGNVMDRMEWDTLEVINRRKASPDNPYALVASLSTTQVDNALTMAFHRRRKHAVFLTNTLGETVLEKNCWCKGIELDMKGLPAGNYQLTVAAKGSSETDSIPIKKN